MATQARNASQGAMNMLVLRRVGFAALLAIPLALLASAVAGIIVAVLAVPLAFILTRDGYLALLSFSYGPYAAAMTLQAVLVATLVWSITDSLIVFQTKTPPPRAIPLVLGAFAGGLGLLGGAFPLFASLNVPWRFGPALLFAGIPALVAVVLGVVSAGVHALVMARHPVSTPNLTGWRADLQQMAWRILAFAVPLAVLFAGWAALLGALGWI